MTHKKFNRPGASAPRKKKNRKFRGNPAFRGGTGQVRRRDTNGKTYGGTITSLDIMRPQTFSPKPVRPLPDADYSTCQFVNIVNQSTGITAGTTNGPMYVTGAINAPALWAFGFSIQDLPQSASFAALFDQYRIDKIEVKFQPQSTAINVMNTAAPNDSVPKLYAVLDFDDSNAVATLAAVLEYDNCQVATYGEGLFVTILPSFTPALYQVGAFSGYAVQRAGWIDMASTAVSHYGLKGAFAGLQALSTSNAFWDVYIKYYVSFRNTR